MKRLTILFFVLSFLCTGIFSQNLNKIKKWQKDLSSTGIPDSTKISLYIDIASEYGANQTDSALVYSDKAEVLSYKTKNTGAYAKALYSKAKVYYYMNDYKASKLYQLKSLEQARKVKDKFLMSKNFNLLGAIDFNLGKYESATNYYTQKLQISIELKDTSSIIETYYNISLISNEKGEYKQSIDYNYKALTTAEQFNDSASILYSAQGLGISYQKINDYKNAMYYALKAKAIAIVLKDNYSLSGILIDEGNIYANTNQFDSAIRVYEEAIEISKNTADDFHYSIALTCIAIPYQKKKEYETAIKYNKEAEKISTKINRKAGLILSYNIFFECYYELGNYTEALKYAKLSESVAQEINAKAELTIAYKNLYRIYEKTEVNDKAFFYFKKYVDLKEKINASKQLVEIAKQELNNEKVRQEQLRTQEQELAKAQFEKQKLIKNIILIASAILLIILLFLYRNYRQKQKANVEITEQKIVIEHKNKDILDSINYSKRIQEALLTPIEEIKKLLPNSFILYKPKDIVSGDFYFIEPIESSNKDEWMAVAMADCTGHGVPGAFMSIMGYNFLKQSLKEKAINEPGQALDFVSKEFYTLLRFHQREGNIRDGMDVAFCAYNKTKNILAYSGANNPIWIISKRNSIPTISGEPIKIIQQNSTYFLYEIKATKQHVGYNENRKSFITHSVNVEKDDLIYLFTDGYADQFGGPKGKKFKYNQLANILLENADQSMEIQYEKLESAFNKWIGELEQVDDVSVLGIRI